MRAFRCWSRCVIYAPDTSVACPRHFHYFIHIHRDGDSCNGGVFMGFDSVLDCVPPISAIQLAKPHLRPLRPVILAGFYFDPYSSSPLVQQIAETASPRSRRRRLVPIAFDISTNSSTVETMNPS